MANPQITDPESLKKVLKLLEEQDKRQNRFNESIAETDNLVSQVISKLDTQNQRSSRTLKIQEDLSKSVNEQYKNLVVNNEQLSQSEKFSELRRKSEEAFAEIYAARINSTEKIKELEQSISEYPKKMIDSLQSQRNIQAEIENLKEEAARNGKLGVIEEGSALDLAQKRLKLLQDQAEEMVKHRDTTLQTLNLERQALGVSKERLSSLAKETNQLKTKEQVAKAGEVLLSKIKQDLNVPTSLADLLEKTYDRVKDIDKATTSLRQKFGLFRSDAKGLEDQITNISGKFAKFGVDADTVRSTMSALGDKFNYLSTRNDKLVGDISLLNKQFGISVDTSADFLKVMGGVSGKSAESKKNMLSFAGAAAKAYGVGLEDVMKDVANASDSARMYAGRNADAMVRAAAQARQMGTTLEKMASTSEKMLDFESSIEAELKASALLGRNINLNEIRRLSFQGKTVEANKKIAELTKQVKFNQLDPIRQKAFADAMGKSVSELMDMTEAQDRLNAALNSEDKTVRDLAKAKLQEQQAMESGSDAAQKKFESDLKSKANQERMVQLQNELNAAIQETMLPMLKTMRATMDGMVGITNALQIDKLMAPLSKVIGITTGLGPKIGSAFDGLKNIGSSIAESIGNIKIGPKLKASMDSAVALAKSSFAKIGKMFTSIFDGTKIGNSLKPALESLTIAINKLKMSFDKVIKFVSAAFNNLKIGAKLESSLNSLIAVSKSLGKILKPISKMFVGLKLGGKFLPALGQVLTVLDALWKSVEKLTEIFSDENLNIGQKIIRSLVEVPIAIVKSVIDPFIEVGRIITEMALGKKIVDGIDSVQDAIFGSIVKPFKFAYETVLNFLGGKSPSKLGKAIVKGIQAIGPEIIQLITTPFKKAVELVKSYFDFDILNKFKGLGSDIKELIVTPFKSAADKIDEFFDFNILGGFENIEPKLKKLLVGPFDRTINLIKKLLTFDLEVSFPNIIGKLKTSLITPFQQSIDNVKKLLNFDLTGGFKNIKESLDTTLIKPFNTAINKIKSFLSFDLNNSFKNIDSILKSSFITPFGVAVKAVKALLSFDLTAGFKSVSSALKTTFITPFGVAVKAVKALLSFDLTAGFKSISSALKTTFITPFGVAVKAVKALLSFDLTTGFKSVSSALKTTFITPFAVAVKAVKALLSFDLTAGFKNVSSALKTTFITPFGVAVKAVKALLSFDLTAGFKSVSSALKTTFITPFGVAVKAVKALLSFDLTAGFKSVSSALKTTFITPFGVAVKAVKALLSFDLTAGFKSVSSALKTTFITPFGVAVKAVKALLSFDLTAGFKSVSSKLKTVLVTPFEKTIDIIKSSFLNKGINLMYKGITSKITDIVTYIQTAFTDIGTFLQSVFINPFSIVYNQFEESAGVIKKSFVSIISEFAPELLNNIKSIGEPITKLIVYPFQTGFDVVKTGLMSMTNNFGDVITNSFNNITSGLELIFNKIKGIAAFITELVNTSINFVGKISSTISVDEGKTTNTVAPAPKIESDAIVDAIISSNRTIAHKLDRLAELMTSGKIAVYVDGQRVNQALATSQVKFGSFGQATTI